MRVATALVLIVSGFGAFGDSLAPEIVYRLQRISGNAESYLSASFMPKRFSASTELHELFKGSKTTYFGALERPYYDSLGPLITSHALFAHRNIRNTTFGIRPRVDLSLDHSGSSEIAEGARFGRDDIRNSYWSRSYDQWRRHTHLRYTGLLFGRYETSDLAFTAFLEGGLGHHFGYIIERRTRLSSDRDNVTYYVNEYEPDDLSTSVLIGLNAERGLRIRHRDIFVFFGGTIFSSGDMAPSVAWTDKNRNEPNPNDFGIVYTGSQGLSRERMLWTGFRAPPAGWGRKGVFKKVLGLSFQECGVRFFRTSLEKKIYELRYPPDFRRSRLDTIPHRTETSGVHFRVVPELHFARFASLSIPVSVMKESRTLYSTDAPDSHAEIVRRQVALEARVEIPVGRLLGVELRGFSGPLVVDNPDEYYTTHQPRRGKNYLYRFSEAPVTLSLVSGN